MHAASLHEDVFALTLSPAPWVEPGAVVRASFVCANVGGGIAENVRVRFGLPRGLTYREGSAAVDGAPLADDRLLFDGGASVGALAPDAERLVTLDFIVAPVIENGSRLPVQAALLADDEMYGSNVVELVVRSRPKLENPRTIAFMEADETNPEAFRVVTHVHNGGQSSAHGVVLTMPVPERTSFVAASARRDGTPLEPGLGMVFTLGTIPAGETVVVDYLTRVDAPLTGDSIALRRVRVSADEVPEFVLQSIEQRTSLAATFAGDGFTLEVSDANVAPGVPKRFTVIAHNASSLRADDVTIRIVLPMTMVVATGSRRVAGRPLADERSTRASESKHIAVFRLHRISAGEEVRVECDGYVLSPATEGEILPVRAELQTPTATRTVEKSVTVRARPDFDPRRNFWEIQGPGIVVPGETTNLALQIVNDGTSEARDVVVRIAENALQLRRIDEVVDGDQREIRLGNLEPNAVRTVRLEARVPAPIADDTELPLKATISASGLDKPIEIVPVTIVADSRPRFESIESWLRPVDDTPVRPNGVMRTRINVTNLGTDDARDVRLDLHLPPELEIAGVDGATLTGSTITLGDIAAGKTGRAQLQVRLLQPPSERTLHIGARLTGANVRSLMLDESPIPALAEPSFANATLQSEPGEAARAGEPIDFVLRMDNTGDGPARRVVVGVDAPSGFAYARGSTTINGISVVDGAAGSPLFSRRGLILEDVAPGTEIEIRWRAFTDPLLVAGTTLSVRAHLGWDDDGSLDVTSNPIRLEARPAFATRSANLAFRIGTAAVRPSAEEPAEAAAEAQTPALAETTLEAAAPVVAEAPSTPAVSEAPSAPPVTETPSVPAASHEPAEAGAPVVGTTSLEEHPGAANGVTDLAAAETQTAGIDASDPFAPSTVERASTNGVEAAAIANATFETADFAEAGAHVPDAGSAAAESTEVRFVLPLDASHVEKIERFLAQAKFDSAITHVFSLRAFFPEVVAADYSDDLESALLQERDALRSVLDRLFIKVRIPNYDVSATDIEDRSARDALIALVNTAASVRVAFPRTPAEPYAECVLDVETLGSNAGSLRDAALGEIIGLRTVAKFFPQSAHGWPQLADALARYRAGLDALFARLATLASSDVQQALLTEKTPELDRIREDLIAALAASSPAA